MSFRVLGRENVEDILGEILERLRRLEHGTAAYPAPGIAPIHTADDHTTAIEVWDEGVDQGDVRILDFIGSGVLAQRFGDRATITITSGGAGGHTIEEDGTPLTARTGLNFAEGLVATDDAGNDETDVNADWATTEIADVAAVESPGVDTKIPRGGHIHAHGSGYVGGHTDVAAHSIIGAEHTSFPGGTTTFLRADGTFAAPPGGGSGDLLVAWVGL